MSMLDYNQGFGAGRAAVAAADRESDAAIAEWKVYSGALKNKLAETEKKVAVTEAYLAGRDAQHRALREALQKLDPDNPALKELKRISALAMQESFAKNGYQYDPDQELLRKA